MLVDMSKTSRSASRLACRIAWYNRMTEASLSSMGTPVFLFQHQIKHEVSLLSTKSHVFSFFNIKSNTRQAFQCQIKQRKPFLYGIKLFSFSIVKLNTRWVFCRQIKHEMTSNQQGKFSASNWRRGKHSHRIASVYVLRQTWQIFPLILHSYHFLSHDSAHSPALAPNILGICCSG